MTLERSKPNSLKLSNLNLLKNNLTLLAGLWVPADSGATITVTNPANGEVVGQVPLMGRAETERAIIASALAQKSCKCPPL